MVKNNIISVYCFGKEIGKVGLDENLNRSYFQYDPTFIVENKRLNLFPQTGIIKPISQVQVFSKFNDDVFKGLPPQIADSLPDSFGNIIFKTWLESQQKGLKRINVLQQLAYIGNRGMGALEYKPCLDFPSNSTIDVKEIAEVLKQVLTNKQNTLNPKLDTQGLINIFKMGTSVGGARPKILISEHKVTGKIIPGDINYSDNYRHLIVKLDLDEVAYPRELIEYCYYLTALECGIRMMPSKMIDNKHFATERFDRNNGKKIHTLTATGLTGWSYKNSEVSSYENLFELALFLKIPYTEIQELFTRMIFNIVFGNSDDHLKNHSFIYDLETDKWHLSPAYDLTYSLNPMMNYTHVSRALSVNSKRIDIRLSDVMITAEKYTIKNPTGIIAKVQTAIEVLEKSMHENNIPIQIIKSIKSDFTILN
ncbi:MAG: type II toxin-antitoxin system HipA family toxin [Flavobacteriales bacterium]|nr:type II toxin-antitoxin system HipA family toxin [Flavobacteriales bacterium]